MSIVIDSFQVSNNWINNFDVAFEIKSRFWCVKNAMITRSCVRDAYSSLNNAFINGGCVLSRKLCSEMMS